MFDAAIRRRLDPLLDCLGARAARHVGADAVTLAGFAIGLAAVPALWGGAPLLALALILANRVLDGLDGAIARARGPTDRGAYIDIVGDFICYAGWAFGFALLDPANAVAAAFLVFSFVGSGSSFLAFAILAAKRGLETTARGRKSFFHLGGLTEGSETIAAFALACLMPGWFPAIAWAFGALCWVTTAGRIREAWRSFA